MALFLKLLKPGGRAAVIVPDGVLFGSSTAHKAIRKMLVEDHRLDGIVKLPSGVFRPYSGVSTAIVIFTKTDSGGTDHVWFYDCQADGFSLDDKRNALLPGEKIGPRAKLDNDEHAKNNLPDIAVRWKARKGDELKRHRIAQSFCVPKAADALKVLHETVAGLNLDNFIVRQRRRIVEKYHKPEAWAAIDDDGRRELLDEVAPLPSANALGTEEAKRFDLLMFSLQLALLKGSKRFDTLRKQLLEIASALEEQTGIPAIAHQAATIEEVQSDPWWEGVTVPLLELVRLRLRDLVQHIEKGKRAIVYSNFADEIGEGVELDLPQVGEADFARFKQKARHFLKAHEDHIVLHKLRQGRPLTPTDLSELEKMLLDAGIGEAGDIERARETSQGFGRFVRSLVGLDRAAVSEAFGDFLSFGTATAAQIEFINMIIEHLTDQGVMEPALLYEPPFTDIAPTGPDQVFDDDKIARLFTRIRAINDSAVA